MKEVYLVNCCRTAVGKFQGSLAKTPAPVMGGIVIMATVIGIGWTVLILFFAAFIGIIGRQFLSYDPVADANIVDDSLVFILMVRAIFPGLISGILLASVVEEGQLTGYFEAWIPIES